MVGFPSAAGLVGFLSEPDHALQVFALEKLNSEIDNIWTEVSGSIGQMYVKGRKREGQHGYLPHRSSFVARRDVGTQLQLLT